MPQLRAARGKPRGRALPPGRDQFGGFRWVLGSWRNRADQQTAPRRLGTGLPSPAPQHGPVPNPHTVPEEGTSPQHLWASRVPCRGPETHPTGPETRGQAQGCPRPRPRLRPAPSQAPQPPSSPGTIPPAWGRAHQGPGGSGAGGNTGTAGTGPAHPQGTRRGKKQPCRSPRLPCQRPSPPACRLPGHPLRLTSGLLRICKTL